LERVRCTSSLQKWGSLHEFVAQLAFVAGGVSVLQCNELFGDMPSELNSIKHRRMGGPSQGR